MSCLWVHSFGCCWKVCEQFYEMLIETHHGSVSLVTQPVVLFLMKCDCKGSLGISDVNLLSGISGLSFDSPLLCCSSALSCYSFFFFFFWSSVLLFFCVCVCLLVVHFFDFFLRKFSNICCQQVGFVSFRLVWSCRVAGSWFAIKFSMCQMGLAFAIMLLFFKWLFLFIPFSLKKKKKICLIWCW